MRTKGRSFARRLRDDAYLINPRANTNAASLKKHESGCAELGYLS